MIHLSTQISKVVGFGKWLEKGDVHDDVYFVALFSSLAVAFGHTTREISSTAQIQPTSHSQYLQRQKNDTSDIIAGNSGPLAGQVSIFFSLHDSAQCSCWAHCFQINAFLWLWCMMNEHCKWTKNVFICGQHENGHLLANFCDTF